MTNRLKFGVIGLIIALVGAAVIASVSDLSFWIGAAIMMVALVINGWVAERVDDW